jgi:hypothetical protein
MKIGKKKYLGDGVYVEYDGYGLILTTEGGMGLNNKIYLESEVIGALKKFSDEVAEFAAAYRREHSTGVE